MTPAARVPHSLRQAIAVTLAGCLWNTCSLPSDHSPLERPSGPEFRLVSSDPEPGAEAVARNAPVLLTFSDRPAPEEVSAATVQLLEGGVRLVEASYELSLASCRLRVSSARPLEPGQLYEVRVTENLSSWWDMGLAEEARVTFTTSDATEPQVPQEAVDDREVVERVFRPHCGCCHDPEDGAYAHILSLDASSIVGAPSRQAMDRDLVAPGVPERSYILYKVLGRPGIQGTEMPPAGAWCSGPWPSSRRCESPDPDVLLLERWIRSLGKRQVASQSD